MSQSSPSRPASTSRHSQSNNSQPDRLLDALRSIRPTVVGNYELGEKIGIGTFGKVHKAVHRLTGQQVAVKVIKRDPKHLQAIEREIDTWRRLRHPNIAQLYEVIVTESRIYMVMEYAAGGEVLSFIKKLNGPLPESLAKRLFLQLGLAVKYCHDRMVVHRDLKLENIMLDGTMSNVKLIDFGFSRHYESKHKFLETLCGSVAYVAPEILGGKKYSGPYADIWSLGVLLYTFVCGTSPFEEDSQMRTQARILGLSYEIPDWIAGDVRDLIEGILKAEPLQRLTIESMLTHPWLQDTVTAHSTDTFLFNGADYGSFGDINAISPPSNSNYNNTCLSHAISTPITASTANPTLMDLDLSTIQQRQSQLRAETGDLRAIRSQQNNELPSRKPPSEQVLTFMSKRPLEERCLIYHLTMIGFDTAEMVRSIRECACDQLSAIYFLLLERLRKSCSAGASENGDDVANRSRSDELFVGRKTTNTLHVSTIMDRLIPQQQVYNYSAAASSAASFSRPSSFASPTSPTVATGFDVILLRSRETAMELLSASSSTESASIVTASLQSPGTDSDPSPTVVASAAGEQPPVAVNNYNIQPVAPEELDAFFRTRIVNVLLSPSASNTTINNGSNTNSINNNRRSSVTALTTRLNMEGFASANTHDPTILSDRQQTTNSNAIDYDASINRNFSRNSVSLNDSTDSVAVVEQMAIAVDERMSLSDSSINNTNVPISSGLTKKRINSPPTDSSAAAFLTTSSPATRLSIITTSARGISTNDNGSVNINSILNERPGIQSPYSSSSRSDTGTSPADKRDSPIILFSGGSSPVSATAINNSAANQQSWRRHFAPSAAASGGLGGGGSQGRLSVVGRQMSIGEESEEDLAREAELSRNTSSPAAPILISSSQQLTTKQNASMTSINSPLIKRSRFGQTITAGGTGSGSGIDQLIFKSGLNASTAPQTAGSGSFKRTQPQQTNSTPTSPLWLSANLPGDHNYRSENANNEQRDD